MWAAVDIGGTFTDLVRGGTGGPVRTVKVPTTPPDLERGVLFALGEDATPRDARLVHGSTVVVNALAERTGARVGLITTRGFRDVLFIGRTERRDLYNLRYRKPAPFALRRDVAEVAGRLGPDGAELEALDEEGVRAAVAQLRHQGVASLAISFVNAYADPRHERRAAKIAADAWPGVPITVATDLSGRWREFERTLTAVVSAYVRPAAGGYLERLAAALDAAGYTGPRALFTAAGGLMPWREGAVRPLALVESGPAGGLTGVEALAARHASGDLLALDVGGTTAKASLLTGGRAVRADDYAFARTAVSSGYPLQVPAVEIVEIGSGGGSIAHLERGAFRVGPRSAGAVPGPAAYGHGGTDPTLTDALVLTGRLAERSPFLGGALPLRAKPAVRAFGPLSRSLGVDVLGAAQGTVRVAQSAMAEALRAVSTGRGRDPRGMTLVAYGGGGPIHAAELARALGIGRVWVPPAPGVFSAWGMGRVGSRSDRAVTWLRPFSAGNDLARAMRGVGAAALADLVAYGEPSEAVTVALSVDLRYRGQEHSVTVEADGAGRAAQGRLASAFADRHAALFGFRLDGPLEVTCVRAAAWGPAPTDDPAPPEEQGAPPAGERAVWWPAAGTRTTRVVTRAMLDPREPLAGPAIVEEATATTAVPPGWRARADASGQIWLTADDAP